MCALLHGNESFLSLYCKSKGLKMVLKFENVTVLLGGSLTYEFDSVWGSVIFIIISKL